MTNSECICLYLAYRDGAVTTDLAAYFGIKLTEVAAVVRRVEREARRRGYDVKSCIRQRGRGTHLRIPFPRAFRDTSHRAAIPPCR